MEKPRYKAVYLYLTHSCDSNCSFCYRRGLFERNDVKTLGPMFMSEQTAFNIIDFVFDSLDIQEDFTFFFWGGEPLLNFKVIKTVVEKYPQFNFHTNTNGKPITEEMYKWFLKHRNITLTWSLGNTYEKYSGLPEKFEKEKWCFKTIKELPNNNVNYICTKYDSLDEDVQYIAKNLTENIGVDIATKFEHKDSDLEIFAKKYVDMLENLKYNRRLYESLKPALFSNLYSRSKEKTDFHFCRTGLDRLFFDTQGGIWQCDNFYVCQSNQLGTINTGVDYSKLELMQEVNDNQEKYLGKYCEECELYKQCPRNKCLGLNLEWMGDMFKPEPSYCKMCKVLFKIAKKYLEINKEQK